MRKIVALDMSETECLDSGEILDILEKGELIPEDCCAERGQSLAQEESTDKF